MQSSATLVRIPVGVPARPGMAALEQLAMDGRLTVRVEDAAAILGIKPQRLREQAHTPEG